VSGAGRCIERYNVVGLIVNTFGVGSGRRSKSLIDS